uniref:Zeta toxin domain-containing protein n=1 Tax=Zooxanthella nutricula TaxID=1333877 RepID=A0A7S2N6J8_9DINO
MKAVTQSPSALQYACALLQGDRQILTAAGVLASEDPVPGSMTSQCAEHHPADGRALPCGGDWDQQLQYMRELEGRLRSATGLAAAEAAREVTKCAERLQGLARVKMDTFLSEWEHAEIVERLTQKAEVMQNPFGIWLAGGPGSGKGHALQELSRMGALPFGAFAHLDVDKNREYLPAWINDRNKPKLVPSVERTQYEAGYINDLAMTLCARQRLNFVIDGTMRNTETTIRNMFRMRKLADQWKHLGARGTRSMKKLRVAVVFIDADVEVCLERVAQRAVKTGRPVQHDFVKECNQLCRDSVKAIAKAPGCVDLFVHVKNNGGGLDFVAGSAQLLKAFVSTNPVVAESEDLRLHDPSSLTELSAKSHWH